MRELEEINAFAKEHNVPVMLEDGLEWMLELLQEQKPTRFLEIGTAIARTSIALAQTFDDLQIVTIERNPQMAAQARENIKACHLEDRILLLEGDAMDIDLPQGDFDVIFIDAAKAQYARFFARYAPLLRDNGIIISDNMNFHGLVDHPERTHNRNTKDLVRKIRAYKSFLQNQEGYSTQFLERGDGVAVTRRIVC